ncbi:MAG: cysteine desulfurase [Anaerolineae bacterium]|jgi:cysteine desulfurase|nr:cysteine desulfurase [Anaerolineae bacterium]
MGPIYFDYNATTPVDPRVLEAMLPYFREQFGNPSSSHAYGLATHAAVDRARSQVADLLGCAPGEIIFTGGGSEADNLAIKGIAEANQARGDHLITTQIEHPAVLATCRYLERRGFRVTYLPVDGYGRVSLEDVQQAITPTTILITIMHANNEVGTLQPLAAIGDLARERGLPFHTDAAQSVGKLPTRVDELGVDLLTVAGHKLYAPKGVGALFIRHGLRLESLIHGAGHEGGRRAGTENIASIVGLGEACHLAGEEITAQANRLRSLRDRLYERLATQADGVHLNGHPTERLPNTLNVSFTGIDGEALLARTSEIAASTGSACHAGRTEPSAVLLAMGVSPELALGAVRFSLGRWTTQEEVDRVASLLAQQVKELRRGVS